MTDCMVIDEEECAWDARTLGDSVSISVMCQWYFRLSFRLGGISVLSIEAMAAVLSYLSCFI